MKVIIQLQYSFTDSIVFYDVKKYDAVKSPPNPTHGWTQPMTNSGLDCTTMYECNISARENSNAIEHVVKFASLYLDMPRFGIEFGSKRSKVKFIRSESVWVPVYTYVENSAHQMAGQSAKYHSPRAMWHYWLRIYTVSDSVSLVWSLLTYVWWTYT